MAYDRFKGLSEEEKNKKREYPRNGYRNMSGKENKQKENIRKIKLMVYLQEQLQQWIE